MSREKQSYRDMMELVNTQYPNRVWLKTKELATLTGKPESFVRTHFKTARVVNGTYSAPDAVRLLCP